MELWTPSVYSINNNNANHTPLCATDTLSNRQCACPLLWVLYTSTSISRRIHNQIIAPRRNDTTKSNLSSPTILCLSRGVCVGRRRGGEETHVGFLLLLSFACAGIFARARAKIRCNSAIICGMQVEGLCVAANLFRCPAQLARWCTFWKCHLFTLHKRRRGQAIYIHRQCMIVYIVLNYLFIYFRGGSSLFKDICFIAQWQCNTLRCRDETIVLGTNDRLAEIYRLEAFLLRFNLQSIWCTIRWILLY